MSNSLWSLWSDFPPEMPCEQAGETAGCPKMGSAKPAFAFHPALADHLHLAALSLQVRVCSSSCSLADGCSAPLSDVIATGQGQLLCSEDGQSPQAWRLGPAESSPASCCHIASQGQLVHIERLCADAQARRALCFLSDTCASRFLAVNKNSLSCEPFFTSFPL